jgi:hypothetical protein
VNSILGLAVEHIAQEKTADVQEEREVRIQLKELPLEISGSAEGEAVAIFQGFIKEVAGTDVRIRKEFETDPNNDPWEASPESKYTMTAKHRPLFQEAETEITPEIFNALFDSTEKSMRKIRYTHPSYPGWKIDELYDPKKDVVTGVWAEYELSPEQEGIRLPSEWDRK